MVGSATLARHQETIYPRRRYQQTGNIASDLPKQSSSEKVVGFVTGEGEERGTSAYQ